jgi:putative Mg2+ transporter-C (MgtC) family protein
MSSAWQHILDLFANERGTVVSFTIIRLFLAAVLGGIIGLERQLRKKPAGLRTNIFICFGSAMFTILSDQLARDYGGDHTRIAAQIIPGIGFIGAGSILHARGSVTGLTTAATLFVVASVGMAAGGGLYLTAIFATGVMLITLALLGRLERIFELKTYRQSYEVVGRSVEEVLGTVNRILSEEHLSMQGVHAASVGGQSRVVFEVDGPSEEHKTLSLRLRQANAFASVQPLGGTERE